METLKKRAEQIKNETKKAANTAERVGGLMSDMVTQIDSNSKELNKHDERLHIIEDRGIKVAIFSDNNGKKFTKEEVEQNFGVNIRSIFVNFMLYDVIYEEYGQNPKFYKATSVKTMSDVWDILQFKFENATLTIADGAAFGDNIYAQITSL